MFKCKDDKEEYYKRKCTDDGAHRFSSRYDWVELRNQKEYQHSDNYAIIEKRYVRDVCEYCGKVVERKE